MAWRAGRPDVDRMLDEVDPAQFDEWVAWRSLEQDTDERLREIVKRGFAALCNCWGAKIEPEMFDPQAKDEKIVVSSPRDAAALFEAKLKAVGM